MTNQYTSIATTGSLGDSLVQAAYDLLVGANLRLYPTMRAFVNKSPARPSMQGSSIVLTKYSDFDSTAITAAKTPLTEESDVDSTKMPAATTVTVTPAEYGFAVTRTKKLIHRTFADIDPEIARAVAWHQSRVLDELIQDTFITGTQKLYADGGSADTTLTASNLLTSTKIRTIKARLIKDGVQPYFGGFYAAVLHPFVIADLREESGSGGWRVPNEYGVNQSDLWTGEISEWEGFRIVSSGTNRWRKNGSGSGGTQVRVHENYFFGRDVAVEEVREEPHTVLSPITDKLQRFRTIGWYGDLGWAIYENKALWRVISSSTDNQQLV